MNCAFYNRENEAEPVGKYPIPPVDTGRGTTIRPRLPSPNNRYARQTQE